MLEKGFNQIDSQNPKPEDKMAKYSKFGETGIPSIKQEQSKKSYPTEFEN